MLEIASQMILCLLLAALLGFIIGYLFGKGTCASDDCGSDIETNHTDTHSSHDTHGIASTSHTSTTDVKSSVDTTSAVAASTIAATQATHTSADTKVNHASNEIQDNTSVSSTSTSSKEVSSSTKSTQDSTSPSEVSTKSTNTKDSSKAQANTSVVTNTTTSNSTDTATTENQAENNEKPVLLSEPRNGKKDNLSRIKGIGMKIEEALNEIGIYHFDQIAAWDAENITWADSTLGFPGRAEREQWVSQAKALDAGEETEFSKRVDAGEVSSSKKS